MMISLVYGYTCPDCACPAMGQMLFTVRVNKGSLRTTGPGLGFLPWKCGDCGADLPATTPVESVWVHGEDREKVNAARARKGWPPLADWRFVPRRTGQFEAVS